MVIVTRGGLMVGRCDLGIEDMMSDVGLVRE
jgi:hypothetical protein